MHPEHDPYTYRIIGAAMEVHRLMGPGLLESVYQACLTEEFRIQEIECQPQYRVPLAYKGMKVAEPLVIDFFFPGDLVLEIKAVEKTIPVHEAQLISYMKLTGINRGLIINFNVPVLKDGIIRRVL